MLGNVAAFVLVWIVVEIAEAAIAVRILSSASPHAHSAQLTPTNQIGGAILGTLKAVVIVALSLVVLCRAAAIIWHQERRYGVVHLKAPSWHPAANCKSWLANGLGHDLNDSLNFFTVTAEPESEQRIELGYTTTGTASTPRTRPPCWCW